MATKKKTPLRKIKKRTIIELEDKMNNSFCGFGDYEFIKSKGDKLYFVEISDTGDTSRHCILANDEKTAFRNTIKTFKWDKKFFLEYFDSDSCYDVSDYWDKVKKKKMDDDEDYEEEGNGYETFRIFKVGKVLTK